MSRVAFKTASESFPKQGNRELPITLDFSNSGTILDNLYQEQTSGQIDLIQSVYIDNSGNASSLLLTFNGMQNITAQPYSQGVYPVIVQGALNYKAVTSPGIKIPIIFSNSAKPFAVWGPTPGANIVPPLTNMNIDIEPLNAGDNILVAAIPGESVKFYRGFFTVGAATILKLCDGAGAGNPLITMYLTAGGSASFQASGIPWDATSEGNALNLVSTQAVNCYGTIGVIQS